MLGGLIGNAMQRGGPPAALDAFLRFAFGDQLVDELDPELRDRLLTNADMVLTIEMPAFQTYRPDEDALRSLHVPLKVLVGEDQQVPLFGEAGSWLAKQTGTNVAASPGAHGPHLSHPTELAALITSLDPGR
jgi:pimeloyl-ACP methyl ester carboxylesterase